MPFLKPISPQLFKKMSLQEWSQWTDWKLKCERIIDELVQAKEQYNKVKLLSTDEQEVFIRAYLWPKLRKQELLLEKLALLTQNEHAPKELRSFVEDHYLNPVRNQVERIKYMIEAEYMRIASPANVVKDDVLASVNPLREEFSALQDQLSQNLESVSPALATQYDEVVQRCTIDLLAFQIFWEHQDLVNHLNSQQLHSLAKAHNNSYATLLIGREALKRAKDDPNYFPLVIELLTPQKTIKDTINFENNVDKEHHYKILIDETNDHLKQDPRILKCQFIKTKIEEQLEKALDSNPWQLGWAGSKHKIQYEGKTYAVPHGISELYHLIQNPEQNFTAIQSLIAAKTTPVNSVHSFFNSVLGMGRSQETKAAYADYSSIIDASLEDSIEEIMQNLGSKPN